MISLWATKQSTTLFGMLNVVMPMKNELQIKTISSAKAMLLKESEYMYMHCIFVIKSKMSYKNWEWEGSDNAQVSLLKLPTNLCL